MELIQKHTEKNILARWNYTYEEWRIFLRWKLLKKSYIHYLIHIRKSKQKKIPEVIITHQRVWIDEKHEHFHFNDRSLKRIDIKDEGRLNVLQIIYEQQHTSGPFNMDIHVPVPKGKLKEAIEVEEKLNMIRNTNQRG